MINLQIFNLPFFRILQLVRALKVSSGAIIILIFIYIPGLMLISCKSQQLTWTMHFHLTIHLLFCYSSHIRSFVSETVYSVWITEIFLFSWVFKSVSPTRITPSTRHYIYTVFVTGIST